MAKTIVIIGASFAGLTVSHALLKENLPVRVILINPTTTFYWNIAAPRILAQPEAFKPEQYLIPFEDAFKAYPKDSFEFIQGYATSIDADAKTVTVDEKQSIGFDYLVIASGSTTPSSLGTYGTVLPFKQPASATVLESFESAQTAIATAKRIVIGGAGSLGCEVAGELADAIEASGRDVSITMVSGSERVLPMLKESASSAAEGILKKKHVKLITSTKVTDASLQSDGTYTVSLDNGETIPADLYIPTTGTVPNNKFIPQDFLDEHGWVNVNAELRVQSSARKEPLPIYACGDITTFSMKLSFKTTEQAAILAGNLKAEITGHAEAKKYDQGSQMMMVVPIGPSTGTGQVFGIVPWGFMVRMVKGKDYFISKAVPTAYGK